MQGRGLSRVRSISTELVLNRGEGENAIIFTSALNGSKKLGANESRGGKKRTNWGCRGSSLVSR